MTVIAGAIRGNDWKINPTATIYRATDEASLIAALAAATAGVGDIVLIDPGGIEVSSTVLVTKSRVRILGTDVGVNPLVRGEYSGIFAAAGFTDGPVMKVSVPCEIGGIGFAGRDTGALFFSGASLLLGGDADANPFGAWIHDCRFPKWGLAARIGIGVEGSSDVLIEDCGFEGVGSALAVGIYVQGATQNITIRRNHFRQVTAAIQYGAFTSGPHAIIDRNVVEDGLILDSQANTAPSFVIDNYSELAAASSYDASVGTLQGQGIQFAGNHYTE